MTLNDLKARVKAETERVICDDQLDNAYWYGHSTAMQTVLLWLEFVKGVRDED